MCNQCQEQFEDQDLAYELILESRLSHPMADAFVLRFCSKAHIQDFLDRIHNQRQTYVLTKKSKGAEKKFEPAFPLDLLLKVGSSQG